MLEVIETPYTLGGTSWILFRCIDLTEGGKSLAKLELLKPRNLFACVSEERCGREKWSRVSFSLKRNYGFFVRCRVVTLNVRK